MHLLPARPHAVRLSYLVWSYVLMGLCFSGAAAVLIGTFAWQGGQAASFVREKRLWAEGTPASWVQVKGKETTHNFLLHDYKLDVAWNDDEGTEHKGQAEFASLFGGINREEQPALRFDPQHPDRFALSWAVELGVWRWLSILFMLSAISLAALGIGILGWSRVKDLRHVRRCAAEGEEVAAEVVSVLLHRQNNKLTGVSTFHFRMQAGDGWVLTGASDFKRHKGQDPLFTSAAKSHVVALVPPGEPRRFLVLRNDFYPLSFSRAEQAEIHARLLEDQPASGPPAQ